MKVDGLTNDEVKSHLQVCICDSSSICFNNNSLYLNKIVQGANAMPLLIHDRDWKQCFYGDLYNFNVYNNRIGTVSLYFLGFLSIQVMLFVLNFNSYLTFGCFSMCKLQCD